MNFSNKNDEDEDLDIKLKLDSRGPDNIDDGMEEENKGEKIKIEEEKDIFH